MSTSKIMMAVIVGCCVANMTLAEPPAKPAQQGKRQMKPAVEKETDAEQGSFAGRVVQMNEKRIVVRNWQEKMTFRPLRPKVKAPEDLAPGDFVKVEWAVAGKGKRINKIVKVERPVRRPRPAAEAQSAPKGEGKGKGEMKREQAKQGQGKGNAEGKGEMKRKQAKQGQGKGNAEGKCEMKREQAKKGQGKGNAEGKCEMKREQAKQGRGKGAKQGAGKGVKQQKRDQSCEGCPKAGKTEKNKE